MMKKILMLAAALLLSASVMAQEVAIKPSTTVAPAITKAVKVDDKTVVAKKPEVKVVKKIKKTEVKAVDTKAIVEEPVKKTKKILVPPAALQKKETVTKSAPFGGLEISGHINAGMGYEYMNNKPAANFGSYFSQEGMKPFRTSLDKKQDFMFYLGDVMMAISKSFDNVAKLRAELVFGRIDSYSNKNFSLGQAYAAFNIKKVEALVGRFNAPMGSESPYINENDLPMHSLAYTFLLPSYLTGVKGYYKFNDMVDLNIWAANDLRDTFVMKGHVPAFGTKVGLNIKKFKIDVAGAFSPEVDVDKYGKFTYIADLNVSYPVTKKLTLSTEGVYRYDTAPTGLDANKYYLGSGKANYKFSPKWDATVQYSFLKDAQGLDGAASINTTPAAPTHIWGIGTSAMGVKGSMHQVALGGQYHLTDNAKVQGLYRLDVVNPVNDYKGYVNTILANLAYSF